jgi:hypothetical protein
MYTLPTQPHPTGPPLFQMNQPIMFSGIAVFINKRLVQGKWGQVTSIPASHPKTATARQQRDGIHPVGYINADILPLQQICKNSYKQLSSFKIWIQFN